MTIRLRYVGHKSNRMLAEGIKRAGGALHAASNDFNQSLAILTAGNASIQDPQSVSQLLKTMSMRLNGASAADLEALGIDTTGMAQGRKSIVQQYKAMAGIDIMEGTNYKSTFQILDELHEKWDSLNMATRQAIAEASGGKRAGSVFASLMTNWEDARKVVEAAERGMAEHSAQKELENASKSVEFSLQRVRAAAQELAYDFLSSDFLKGAIEAFAKFVEVSDKVVDATHGVVPAVAAAAGAFYAFSTINGLMKTLGAGMKMLQKATDTETKSTLAQIAAKIKQAIAERALAKAKKDTAKASVESTVAQKAETSAQQADIATNTQQTLSESAKKGKIVQFPGAAPNPTPIAEGAGGAAGLFGIEGLTASMVAAAAAIAAVVAGLAVVGGTMAAISERNKELQQSASELGNKYKESANDIDGYKERIEALRETIDSSSTSYEEAKEARQELLGIQSELIEKYGGEEGSIRLVTDAINGQVNALDELKKRQWEQTKNDYNATKGTGWTDYWNHVTTGTSDNIELLQKKMYDSNIAIGGFSFDEREFLKKMNEVLGGEFTADISGTNPESTLEFSGQLDEVLDKLYKVQELSKDFDLGDSFKQNLTDLIKSTQEEYNNYLPMADQLVLNDSIRVNFENELKQMESAYDNYQEAILNKDNETAEQAKQNMVDIINSLEDADVTPEVLKYFRSKLFPDIQADLGKWELAADLKLTPVVDSEVEVDIEQDSSSQALKDLLSDVQQFSSENDLMNFNAATALDTQSEAYSRLSATAKLYGLEISDLISLLREMGALSSLDRDNNGYLARGIEKARGANYGTGRLGIDNAEKQNQALYDAFNRLSDEDYEIASTFGATQYKEIATAMNEAADASGEIVVQGKALDEILAAMISKTKEEKGLLEETAESLSVSDQLSEIQSLTDGLGKLKKVYEDVQNGEEFDWSSILNNDDFENAFTAFEGATERSKAAYEDFINAVSSNPADISATQEAFNNLVTTYLEESGALDNVTQATRDRTTAMLEQMGITNANAVIEQALADAEARLWLEEQNVANVTPEVVAQLFNEGVEAGNTESAMLSLVAEMNIFSNTSLSVGDKVAALQELAAQAGITASAINGALGAGSAGAGIQAGRVRAFGKDKAAQMLKDEWNAAIKRSRTQAQYTAPSGGGKKTGGGGGGGGGKSDAEKETDILKELSSQLDEIQAAYSSLNEIVEAYNENGKLTIDQAQELINTDFRYLAMLTNQNGQLQLNEQGFQNLAQAKLQEMKIQLARNAIDTVNSLKTEADAVNFLTYAYEGLAGATLDATEAQLRMAVAAAHARGAKQGKAADDILAGYEATKVAIGNVDFGKDSLGGKKDSDKDKTDKDKNSKDADKKQEETKTKWNWLDRLVNKIQRTIDQLAKRAEKYFNYVEKNALVDKQLAANRRMIATQELSVAYYQNKASKYLKKVPKKYRSLISGDFDPAGIKNLVAELGSGKTKKLQDYLEWQDLLEKSQDALAEAYDNERSLITNKLDNILDYFDTLIGYQQNIQKGIEAQMNIRTAKGLGTDINDLLSIYGEQRNMIDTSAQRERAYIDQANAANNDIIKSYKDQIDNVSNGYQDTVAYQKLKNKGKQGRAKKELNSEYRVLAEDVDAYIKASKNQNKKGSKGQEARATMERLHKKYEDYVAELRKEQAEASAATSAALADQVQQNRTATDEMRAQIWETIKSVLDSLFETYEKRVRSLDTVVNKWGTVAEALSDLDDDTIKRYGLRDMFGVTAELSDVLLKQKQAINDEIAAYKNEYDLYQDMIAAAKSSTNEERMVRFRDILERQDLSGTSREKIEGFLEELVKGQDWQHTEWTTELEEGLNEVMSSSLELVNTAEDIGEKLLDKINESTNKLIDSLRALQEAYNAKAGLINDEWTVDSNGITDYGLAKVAALNDAANVARQIAAAYYKAYTNLVNLSDEARNDESFDEDAYNLELNKAVKNYYESVKDIHSAYDEIYQIANQSLQNEVDNLSKLIENYKEALNAKKSYYDYDKRLKEQNKNIQNLQSEIAALQGVGDAASKARLKALQSELKDAQDELDDTVFNHQIEVETAALDKLIADMTEALKDTADTIQKTFEKWSKSISEVTDAARAKDTEAVFSDLIYFLTKGIMSDEARTAEQQYQEQIAAESDNKQVSLNELISEKSTKESELLDAYNQHLADVEDQYQASLGNALWWYQNKLIAVDEYWHQSGDATLGVLPEDPTSEAESRRIIYDEYVAAVQSATTKRNNDNAGWEQWYTTETSKLNNKYDRQIELLTKEVNDLENLILTGQTVAPSTDIPGSVYADMAAGAYSSLASGVNLSTGTTADILKVIAGADGVPKISGDLSSIKVNMVDVTANVRTIANNTNTMVEQLNAIKDTITDPEINLKIEGEDLYSGLKRVGKVVIYH